jgi:glycosyltransferase involved in cell wall biosynthesis
MPRPALAYVVNALNPGGTEKLVVEMARVFAREYDLSVVCLDEPGIWGRMLRREGISVHCLWRHPGMDLSMPGKLARLFRSIRARIVHAHQCTPWFYSALSRLRYRRPRLLLEEHGRFYPEVENRARALVNRRLIRKLTHRFVAVSADVRTRLERYEGLDASQIRVIYNGVSAPPRLETVQRDALRAGLGIGPGDFVVGTVGRFDPIKNLPMLVNALAQLAPELPAMRGLLVGDGPEFPGVQALVEANGLAGRVTLTGFREDARQLAQCMDLFVLPSFSEGTSMALLEAIAAGVPVVVTAVGGNPEIVMADETGWVVPSDDVAALQCAVREAVRNPAERQRRAEAGCRRFHDSFGIELMMAHYRDLYLELLSTKG